jgi:hypothetical protein
MRRSRRWSRRAGLVAAGAMLAATPIVAADETAPGSAVPELRALASAAAWHDVLEGYRVPELPPPGDTESVIVLLRGSAAGAAGLAARPERAAAISLEQQRVEQSVAGMGGVVTFRYRMLVNGLGVRVPTGRLATLAALPAVRAVVPVSYLAPAAEPSAAAPSAPIAAAPARAGGPRHLALIDGGVDVSHPWLGGGIGPTHPIVGGADLVERDADPTLSSAAAEIEPHATQMASIVLRAPEIEGLEPAARPRLVSYRVVAAEQVEGRMRPLARTDRVLAALERAVDPNGDGRTEDAPEVILIGLSRGFDGGGLDPVATAIDAADALGSLVVVPAGNDGPTFSRSGSVGGPAAAERALVVGGLGGEAGPRTARLEIAVGDASASTDPLPVLGGSLPAGDFGVTVTQRRGALSTGTALDDYTDGAGRSLVEGRVAMVVRGGGSLLEKARAASAAGAVALVVWDQEGPGVFPGLEAEQWPLPVVGIGPRQGAALRDLLSGPDTISVTFSAGARRPAPAAVAGFSSRGPTGDGRAVPHVIAPAVGIEAAYPGQGQPRSGPLTGTSAAAAAVAAHALRIRLDRPELSPADVRSIITANARPIEGAGVLDQGAGVVGESAAGGVTVSPAVVTLRPGTGGVATGAVRLRALAPRGRYRLSLERGGSATRLLGPPRRIGTTAAPVAIEVPVDAPLGADLGYLVVRNAEGAVVGRAPMVLDKPVSPGVKVLGVPQVRVQGGAVQVALSVGKRAVERERLQAVRLSGVRMWLVPRRGEPVPVSGDKQPGDWPAGTYRFVLARRVASGTPLPSGRFRLRVTARAPDGGMLSRDSRVFVLR